MMYFESLLGGNPKCGYSQVGVNTITLPESGLIFKLCEGNKVFPSFEFK